MNWTIDTDHSEVTFKIKHMMISNVTGGFNDLQLTVESENANFATAKVNFVAKAASIDTRNQQRDDHLRSADFFDTDNFPDITFIAKGVNVSSGKLTGDLTIKNVTQQITLDIDFMGVNTDPWGNEKAGFEVEGKIKRTDFGLTWNTTLETGGVLVSDDVRISAEIQLIQQQ